jgi:phage/plasmid-like protein (TIGR03299 family)
MFRTSLNPTNDVNMAMEAGNHDYQVEKRDLYTPDGLLIPDYVANINVDTGDYLGTVGRNWQIVQPSVMYELAEELMNATDGKIDSVYNLRNGSVMGISFHLADREYIDGDPIALHFLMLNAFDGSHGLAGHAPTYRSSCLNVCNASNKVYNTKHTKNILNRVEVIKNMLRFYQNEIANFDRKMNSMVSHRMNEEEAVAWFRSLFPTPKTRQAETRMDNQVLTFIDCLRTGRGSEIAGVKGTAYGAFQALTEFINYYKSTRVPEGRDVDEVRFESIHFGSGNTLTQKGMNKLSSSFELTADDFLLD